MVISHSIIQGGRVVHALLLLMSEWGFAIVVASFLQIQIGFLFNGDLSLPPLFIGGLFILALLAGIDKLNRNAIMPPKG
jgi:hypothetical protein